MHDHVRLEWEPTEADYVAEQRRIHPIRQALTQVVGVTGALVLPVAVAGRDAPPIWLLGWASLGLAVLVGWAVWRIPVVQVRRAMDESPERHPTGTVVLEADAAGLMRRAPSWEVTHPWDAVERLELGRSHVFVFLSDVQVIAVPRRLFGTPGEEVALLDRLRALKAGARGALVPASTPDPGRDLWVLRYRLHAEDWALFMRKIETRRLRSRPLLLAIGLLLPILLIAAQEPWAQGIDPALMVLMLAFGGLFVAVGALRWWVPAVVPWLVRRGLQRHPRRKPLGDLVLGAGSRGGWLQTPHGVSRFAWASLVDLVNDADGVLLLFSDEVGVPVPERAFDEVGAQDAFADAVRDWCAGRAPPATPLPVVKRDRDGPIDVFSPPEER